ncbi:MAG TPA: M23 family metallopeptidase [Acidimicrobiia bacterium]|nr:M23 family metallopeptidase [Acidimicrobiia bacterium]
MSGRRAVSMLAMAALIAALHAVTSPTTKAEATETCPPVTMDALFPPTTLPAPITTTSTTIPAETTTVPETTTTTTPGSSTTDAADSTTTLPAPDTTSTDPAPATTTTTTVPETTTTAPPPPCDPFVYDMSWPLAGAGQIGSPFGADRDGGARKHQGNDIAAPKLTPVLAVADGVVVRVTQDVGTEECCWAIVEHHDGWQSYYIHLNNDRHGTDDGLGVGARTDLAVGSAVARGEVIGWVGDSGNAEETVPHLHFELRNPEGVAIDPRASLEAARSGAILPDPEPTWPYLDDDGHPGEEVAAWLLSDGLLLGCDESYLRFCPDQVATPELASVIAAHVAGKAPPAAETRSQPLPGLFQNADPAPVESALGCAPVESCVQIGLTEVELARIAMWVRIDAMVATLLPAPPAEGSPRVFLLSAEEAEARLRSIGALEACKPPLDGETLLTRAETAIRLISWVRGADPEPCPPAQPTF